MSAMAGWTVLAPLRQARIRFWLEAVHSRAAVADVEAALERMPAYQQLADDWDGFGPPEKESAAQQLDALFRQAAYATRPYCVRCGTCCHNAGPTLHGGDEALVHTGRLRREQLVTFRVGEEVFSHVEGRRVVLQHECVMVRAAPRRGCALFDPTANSCAVYEHRPRQCRVQRCWDPAEAEELARGAGLSRLDLVSAPVERRLIEQHERACAVSRLRELSRERRNGAAEAAAAMDSMIAQDTHFRRRLVETVAVAPAALRFLLGRPVAELFPR